MTDVTGPVERVAAWDAHKIKELEARPVSLVALDRMTSDLTTPHGRIMATMLPGIAEFGRGLTQERIRSRHRRSEGARQAPCRQPGQRPISNRCAPQVLALVEGAQLSLDW